VRPITLRPKAGADWATEIRRLWAEGEFRVIELAKAVVRAKLQLRRGEWTALWLDSNVPFSQRKAEMLVVVGARLAWANPQTFAHLPQGWSILYYLARIERIDLEDFIVRGIVHPRMTLSEAKKLLKVGHTADPMLKLLPDSNHLNRFSTFVRETLPLWSEDQRMLVRAELRDILSLISGVPAN